MEKMYEKFCSIAQWNEKIGDQVTQYQYVKKVFLDSTNNSIEEKEIIEKIQKVLQKENIKDSQNLDNILNENKILQYSLDTDFTIRKINYFVKNNSIEIINCVVMFLFNRTNSFFELLTKLAIKDNIDDMQLKFFSAKEGDEIYKKSTEIVSELLEISTDKSEIYNFFTNSKILYGGELKLDEIRKLREASKFDHKFIIPTIKGIIFLFVSAEEIDIDKISTVVKDANFYVGGKTDTNMICKTKIEEGYKEPKVKVILKI